MIRLAAVVVFVAGATAAQTPDPQAATFKAGTRLVEVEVVVRNNKGPVTGLTKGDFTILDEGRPQRIDVFRAGQTNGAAAAIPQPPGFVSNRGASGGEGAAGAAAYTAVLYDQLNTRIDLKDYERKALIKFVRGMRPGEHVAIYVLGRNLHALQDFTDDPAKLLAALQHVDSGRDLMPANVHDAMSGFETDALGNIILPGAMIARSPQLAGELGGSEIESAKNVAQVNAARNDETTFEALQVITRHLSGMPGRRNLVWMMESPYTGLAFSGMLVQANIALYPVLAHSLEFDPTGMFMGYANNVRQALNPGEGIPGATLMPDVMDTQRKARQVGELTGGAGFSDAEDLQLAVKTAEEDSQSAYTLGYYPSEELLDGKYHRIAVKVAGGKPGHLEIRYRPGYVASKQVLQGAQKPTLAELFRNPLDDTEIGIAARSEPDSMPGFYKVRLILDVHDLHLVHQDGHSRGSIELGFLAGNAARVRTIAIDLTDEQLAAALRDGYQLRASGVPATENTIRVVARDPSTGVAGSLTIAVKH